MTDWRILVPVKNLRLAKSRTGLTAEDRAELACAMLLDVLAALGSCARVTEVAVCTRDLAVAGLVTPLGIHVVAVPGASLNGDLIIAAEQVGNGDSRLGVVTADLPCARADDFATLLAGAPEGAGFVPSPDGGTTVLLGATGAPISPQFGRGSAHRHGTIGTDLGKLAGERLRRDVDTSADLDHALSIGAGPNTTAWAHVHARPALRELASPGVLT